MGLSPAKFKTSFGREGKLWGGRGMSEIRKGEGVGGRSKERIMDSMGDKKGEM